METQCLSLTTTATQDMILKRWSFVRRFFNCVAKNLVREMTNSANQHTVKETEDNEASECRWSFSWCFVASVNTNVAFAFAPLRLLCSSSLIQSLQIINGYNWYYYKGMEASIYHILSFYGRFM